MRSISRYWFITLAVMLGCGTSTRANVPNYPAQSIQAYYDAVPSGPARVKGTLIGPDHLDLIGQPDCSKDWTQRLLFTCTGGVYGYLGYSTAWMMAQLQGDKYAESAFAKSGGEIF